MLNSWNRPTSKATTTKILMCIECRYIYPSCQLTFAVDSNDDLNTAWVVVYFRLMLHPGYQYDNSMVRFTLVRFPSNLIIWKLIHIFLLFLNWFSESSSSSTTKISSVEHYTSRPIGYSTYKLLWIDDAIWPDPLEFNTQNILSMTILDKTSVMMIVLFLSEILLNKSPD